ncbi:MAG: site-specific integrase [Bacteroidales bacterium]|nr:site-specific integrase [Bacteroidales bacterium]
MEAHSFRLELNNRPTRNNKWTIYICITVGGVRKKIKTPYEVDKRSDFNSKCVNNNWIKKSLPYSKKWNDELARMIEESRNKYLELDKETTVSSGKVADAIKAKNVSESFIEFAAAKIQSILDSGGIRNWKKHSNFLNKLKKYQKGKDLLFSEIDYEYITNFKAYLDKLPNERHPEKRIHPNTVQEVLNEFRSNINKAIKEGKMAPEKNPFMVFQIKGVKTVKDKLTADEIESIKALELKEGSLLWHCRNYFLFSFYCAGIRAGDLIQMRWRNIVGERLNYQMGKNHKVRDLVLVEPALKILDYYRPEKFKGSDYIFPLLDPSKPYAKCVTEMDYDSMNVATKQELFKDISAKNALINKELNKIAELAGIDKRVSMHISRHSFAKIAKDEGTDNSAIQKMLAHSSLKITEGYMGNFDTNATDEALKNVFKKKVGGIELWINKISDLIRDTNNEEFAKTMFKEIRLRIASENIDGI